jgi:hypothetical protein
VTILTINVIFGANITTCTTFHDRNPALDPIQMSLHLCVVREEVQVRLRIQSTAILNDKEDYFCNLQMYYFDVFRTRPTSYRLKYISAVPDVSF